ncbi:MAG: RimK family alpha-L-glutamate ligase [Mangrovibacterium sp.]
MNKKYSFIPKRLKSILKKTSFYKKRAIKNGTIVAYSEIDSILDEAPPLLLKKDIVRKPMVGIIRTKSVNFVDGYVYPNASWLRYERFCKNNKIPYGFYDITKSSWIKEAKKYDIIICHTEATPSYQNMIESKIYILEKILGKYCFPSFHEVWQYEDKNRSNYLYQCYDLPIIPTYVTNNLSEAYDIINKIEYPFITKTTIGAGSTGIKMIASKRQAIQRIKKIFNNGLKTQYSYQKQKDYIFIQKFIDDATFDLRIMLVGNKAFGYYRYPNKDDFRASGAGNTEKKAIPLDALLLAINIRNKLNSRQMGVDLLFSEKYNQYFIIETSLFNQIDTPVQLAIEGVAGYYDISDVNNIFFKEGKFWIQELVLKDVIMGWANTISHDGSLL